MLLKKYHPWIRKLIPSVRWTNESNTLLTGDILMHLFVTQMLLTRGVINPCLETDILLTVSPCKVVKA